MDSGSAPALKGYGVWMVHENFLRSLDEVARDLGAAPDVDAVLQRIVQAARASLEGVDEVGLSVTHRDGSLETKVWTGELVTDLDALQDELGEGPCLDSVDPRVPEDLVRVDDARHEQRWPRYIPKALDHGLRAQLGLRLYTEDRTVGGLNVYSTSVDVISKETELMAELFATHAALALGRVRKESQLTAAMSSRELIGQATGIVMQRYQLDAQRAFDYLLRLSQDGNVKLRDLAAGLVGEFAS